MVQHVNYLLNFDNKNMNRQNGQFSISEGDPLINLKDYVIFWGT